MEQISDALYPFDTEHMLVSAIVLSNRPQKDAILDTLRELSPSAFSDQICSRLFGILIGFLNKGDKIDLVTVMDAYRAAYGAEAENKAAVQIIEDARKTGTCFWSSIPKYAEIIRDAHKRRLVAKIADALMAGARDPTAEVNATIDTARLALRGATQETGDWITGLEAGWAAYYRADSDEKPIATGFAELDKVLSGGLFPSELTIVGARPGKGKSAFALTVAMNTTRAKKHVAYFSLEMGKEQIGQREISSMFGAVSMSKIRAGKEVLSDNDWFQMMVALDAMQEANFGTHFHILSSHGVTVEKLAGLANNMRDRDELDLLIVDYMQLLRTAQKTSSLFERLTYVSNGLKELALDLGVPILAAAQVRRQSGRQGMEQRAPTMDELRGTGDFEQDADNILLVHKPETPEDATLKNLPDVHVGIWERAMGKGLEPFTVEVAKQRQGACMRTWSLFKPAMMMFYDDA